MKVSIRICLFILLGCSVSAIALADIPNPNSNRPRNPSRSTPMLIRPDPGAKDATLVIPRDAVQQLAETEAGPGNPVASTTVTNWSTNSRTVIAGTFLSLAIVFGGVWLVRKRPALRSIARVAGVVVIAALVGVASGVAFGNAGPPPIARSLTVKILTPEIQVWGATGSVRLQASDKVDRVTLLLPVPSGDK